VFFLSGVGKSRVSYRTSSRVWKQECAMKRLEHLKEFDKALKLKRQPHSRKPGAALACTAYRTLRGQTRLRSLDLFASCTGSSIHLACSAADSYVRKDATALTAQYALVESCLAAPSALRFSGRREVPRRLEIILYGSQPEFQVIQWRTFPERPTSGAQR
jgi:hypothetical protein